MSPELLVAAVTSHYKALDEALNEFSDGNEGLLSDLPSWVLTRRTIQVHTIKGDNPFVLIITPNDEDRDEDDYVIHVHSDISALARIAEENNLKVDQWPLENEYLGFGDITLTENKPYGKVQKNKLQLIVGRGVGALTPELAKKDAVNFWNNVLNGLPASGNFVQQAQSVVDRLRPMIKQKAFKERRIHRFIRDHSVLCLPKHSELFFEKTIRGEDGKKKYAADFILKTDDGRPPIMIELENTVHKVLTSKGDLTAPVNHAIGQIRDWRLTIRKFPQAQDQDASFLNRDNVEEIVVIGRDHRPNITSRLKEINDSSNVTVWTYDDLLRQVIKNINSTFSQQASLISLKDVPLVT